MSKNRGKKPYSGIVNSHVRTLRRMALNSEQPFVGHLDSNVAENINNSVSLESSENISVLNVERNAIVLKVNETLHLGYSRQELDEREMEVLRGEMSLPVNVRQLFELTRDGKPTPPDYESKLLQPEVRAEDMANAIRLGIKAWAPSILSKEY